MQGKLIKLPKKLSKAPSGHTSLGIAPSSDGKYIFIHSNRGLAKYDASIYLEEGKTSVSLVCSNDTYRNSEVCSLGCIKNKIYVWSSKLEWPMVEVVNAETLKVCQFIMIIFSI